MKKIVAVIPARAGSKGIPNKNIRLLNGKPMISYAISNALNSKYITDVIVSSDSDKVLSIAEIMGAIPYRRNFELCGDSVTLDSVIYDVIKKIECDVVVTMQPTSPTLTVDSLDRAIEQFISSNLDTLISCVNDPRLSWKPDEMGVIRPAYEERVNRQYMKPEYVETGAFFITKREYVRMDSRLGNKISVYEIPHQEAVDIDTFTDFLIAQHLMKSVKVAFFTNGNSTMGTGHVQRALTVADLLDSKPDIYYNSSVTPERVFGNTTHRIIPVSSEQEFLQNIQDGKYGLLINDTLSTSYEYIESVKKMNPGIKIINFDDVGEGSHLADYVLNPFLEGTDTDNMKFGSPFFILNNIYTLLDPIVIQDRVNNVFVCFGGADPANYTEQIVKILLKEKYRNLSIVVVMGNSYQHTDKILKLCEGTNIEPHHNVSNIYEYMLKSDIAISSRGITGYELGSLGIPTITLAENELEETHSFLGDEHGYLYIGRNPSNCLLENTLDEFIQLGPAERQTRQDQLLRNDLRNGANRVRNVIDYVLGGH